MANIIFPILIFNVFCNYFYQTLWLEHFVQLKIAKIEKITIVKLRPKPSILRFVLTKTIEFITIQLWWLKLLFSLHLAFSKDESLAQKIIEANQFALERSPLVIHYEIKTNPDAKKFNMIIKYVDEQGNPA